MDARFREVMLGAQVCAMLKTAFFPQAAWDGCCRDVASMLSALKVAARCHDGGKSDMEILDDLVLYTADEFREAFGK